MSRERLDSAADAAQSFHPRGAEVIIRMQGLPYDCTSEEVVFVYKHLLNNSFKIFAIFFPLSNRWNFFGHGACRVIQAVSCLLRSAMAVEPVQRLFCLPTMRWHATQ